MHNDNATTSTAYENDVLDALYGILRSTGKYVDVQQTGAVLRGFRAQVRELMRDRADGRGTMEDMYRGDADVERNGRSLAESLTMTSSYDSSLSSTIANLSGDTLVEQRSRGQTPVPYNDSSSSSSESDGGGLGGTLVGRHYRSAEFNLGMLDGEDGDDEDEN